MSNLENRLQCITDLLQNELGRSKGKEQITSIAFQMKIAINQLRSTNACLHYDRATELFNHWQARYEKEHNPLAKQYLEQAILSLIKSIFLFLETPANSNPLPKKKEPRDL